MINWKDAIANEMASHDDSWGNVESCTLTEHELSVMFYDGFGSAAGIPFTVWTKSRVYFPVTYDGSELCASVARHPDGKPTAHIGG